MDWNIAKAKQDFSEVVRAASTEPQRVFNRDRLVAVVVSADEFEIFAAWRRREAGSFGSTMAALRRICQEEDYSLELPLRSDRANPFAEGFHDVPR